MNSLKKNILKNGLATGFQKTVRVLEQLLLVPFFISAWGVDYYGEWLTLTIIPTMLAFSDFGFGSAAANSFVLSYLAGAKDKAADVFKTGFVVISASIIVGLVLSVIVLFVLDYNNVFSNLLINKQDAIWAVSILIFSRLFFFYNQLYGAYYVAARKAAISINLLSVYAFLNMVGGALILVLDYGVITFAISQLIITIFFNFYFMFKGRKLLELHREHKGEVKKEYVREITKKGFGYLMSPIWQAIFFQGTTFVVRIVIGPTGVVIFNTVRTLTRSLNQFFNMVNGTVFPELQYEYGQGNIKNAQKLFRMSITLVLFIALIGALFLSFFGLWFYNIWTNNELDVPFIMWNIFIVSILFNAIWWTTAMIYRALNKPFFLAKVGILVSVISVITSYFLGKHFGLNGIALGTLVLDVLMAIFIFPNACRLMGLPINLKLISDSYSDFKLVVIDYKSRHTK